METVTLTFEVTRDSSGLTMLTIPVGTEIVTKKDNMPVATPQGKVIIRKSTIQVGSGGKVETVTIDEQSQARALHTIGSQKVGALLKATQQLKNQEAKTKLNQFADDLRKARK